MTNIFFPDIASLKRTIDNLNIVDLDSISYEKIYDIISNEIKLIPIDNSKYINQSNSIFRGRINDNYLFNSENEISYNPNEKIIKNYGRFNKPFQQTFYGSTVFKEDDGIEDKIKFDMVIDSIIDEIKDNIDLNRGNDIRLITVGCWKAKESFEVISSLFDETHAGELMLKYPDNIEEIKLIFEFYLTQLKKHNSDNNHNNYKISSAYYNLAKDNLILDKRNFNGILYQSIKGKSLCKNIALTADTVKTKLELKKVKLYLVRFFENNFRKECIMYSDNLGIYNTSFQWEFSNDIL